MATDPDRDTDQTFAEFCATVRHSIITCDVSAPEPDSFRGSFGAGFSRDVHLLDIAADTHAVHRTNSLVKKSPQAFLKFSIVEEGSALIVQDGRETALNQGDMTVYDTNRPYTLAYDGPARMSIIMFPKEQLDIPANVIANLTARKLSSSRGTGAIIRPFISSLAENVHSLDDFQTRRMTRSAIDLLGTLFDEELTRIVPNDEEAHLLNAIYGYIDDHIGDPGLNPAQIAAAHFISVRSLHSLFTQQQTTVSTLIRTRRLQNCHDDIVNPLLADRPLNTIASGYGFLDPAHFSRLFRNYFGISPSEMRRRQNQA
ncbi:AraC-like ligand-binding domain-containing protein [Gulosibacter molinativorax]|uniref:AraC family transcriptional regulator n=1 Tax=Gulosibacter molinativorax TaxID=256821 RepID=A0ABT7C7B8_9MICO|nr:helix-turn-helix domain-containing protein [Gulosibacter molinativorax]MDJ1371008.1 AraC family transcriptional regulator [Gulosibacter molinativorax]QUY62802.1 Transcriptional activator NphR [Gulosibacter molinativorax]